jgi:hemoglobin
MQERVKAFMFSSGKLKFLPFHAQELTDSSSVGPTTQMEEHQVYAAIGPDGFDRLAAAFYQQIPADDILGPMYPADDLQAGGTAATRFSHLSIRRATDLYRAARPSPASHAPCPFPDRLEGPRPLGSVDEHALEQAMLPEEVQRLLRDFFGATATFLVNRVPASRE